MDSASNCRPLHYRHRDIASEDVDRVVHNAVLLAEDDTEKSVLAEAASGHASRCTRPLLAVSAWASSASAGAVDKPAVAVSAGRPEAVEAVRVDKIPARAVVAGALDNRRGWRLPWTETLREEGVGEDDKTVSEGWLVEAVPACKPVSASARTAVAVAAALRPADALAWAVSRT